MAKSMNLVILMGNLTRNPELRSTPGGSDVVSFSIALNRSYKVDDEWKESTDYIDIVAWGTLAKQVNENVSSGSKVLVSGRLQSRSWETEGVKKNKVEVLATDVTFLDRGDNDRGNATESE